MWSAGETFAPSWKSIITFEVLFWHLHWVEKCYFDFLNPLSTFSQSRKMSFWHKLSCFGHYHWVEKCYPLIQNPILSLWLGATIKIWFRISFFDSAGMSKYDYECRNSILRPTANVKNRIMNDIFDSVRISKYGFKYQNSIFRLSANVKIGFCITK